MKKGCGLEIAVGQSLCRSINACDAPPAVAAVALQLLGAPSKDPAMIALARSCSDRDEGPI